MTKLELIRPQPTFTIPNAPVYGSLRCSASSVKTLNSLEAFDFAREQGMILQSAGQAMVARKAFYDDAQKNTNASLDFSNGYQKLSTVSLKYLNGSDIVSVFAELDSSDESRLLLENGVKANNTGRELFLSVDDVLVQKLLSSGRKTSPLEENHLTFSVQKNSDGSDYSRNDQVIALFGSSEIAEMNASYLRSRGRTTGSVYDLTKANLEKLLKGKEGTVLARPVGLGGDDFSSIYDFYTFSNFDVRGRARGFAQS